MLPESSPPSLPPSSVEEMLRPRRKALAALARSPAISEGDVAGALAQLTEVAASVLGVERASVWRLDEAKNRIECVDLFERSKGTHSRGLVLQRRDAPRYFAALDSERNITVADAHTDPRTSEFAAGYLAPLGIGALLDAPIFEGASLVGVVCHEHVGPRRRWQLWEELVAGTMADLATIVLLSADRVSQDRALREHQRELERLVEERTAELRESERDLRKLFEASPVPLVLLNAASRTIRMKNRRAVDLLGDDPHFDRVWVNAGDAGRLEASALATTQEAPFRTELRGVAGHRFYAELDVERLTHEGQDAFLVGIHDVTRQQVAEAALVELAAKDGLTGVYNRRRFLELAEEECERADRYRRPVSFALLDVDHFKSINDTYGHATGDAVLRELAARLVDAVRRPDLVGRLGGEEFIVLFPETTRDAADHVCRRIHQLVGEEPFPTPAGPRSFTVSIGVIERTAEESLEQALDRADRAMYVAKEAGRNRVVVA